MQKQINGVTVQMTPAQIEERNAAIAAKQVIELAEAKDRAKSEAMRNRREAAIDHIMDTVPDADPASRKGLTDIEAEIDAAADKAALEVVRQNRKLGREHGGR